MNPFMGYLLDNTIAYDPAWVRGLYLSLFTAMNNDPVIRKAMTREDCLDKARKAVSVDREATHGNPEDNFTRIAEMWTAYIGGPTLSAHDVALMMILFKSVRARGNPDHYDSWIDIAGYAACGMEASSKGS